MAIIGRVWKRPRPERLVGRWNVRESCSLSRTAKKHIVVVLVVVVVDRFVEYAEIVADVAIDLYSKNFKRLSVDSLCFGVRISCSQAFLPFMLAYSIRR